MSAAGYTKQWPINMTMKTNNPPADRQTAPQEPVSQPLCIAILAIGGQGGGVLSNWLRQLAEDNDWRAQTTSVPGVAQRTGATLYYLEMLPDATDAEPILALMPAPGQVDVVIAAELMEAGRAIQRGLVTPTRTTLITSQHRAYAVAEKSAPGDGTADPRPVLDAARAAAKRFLCADMAQLANAYGSVISASLFGAIAAAEVLPFPRSAFEATIRASGGNSVDASLAAFTAGFDEIRSNNSASSLTQQAATSTELPTPQPLQGGRHAEQRRYQAAQARIKAEFPDAAHSMLLAGLNAVVDYQDARYGDTYLDYVATFAAHDQHRGPASGAELTIAAAKHIANALCYDDIIRVASLKTRAPRDQTVRAAATVGADDLLRVTEFLHPRLDELCELLPARLGSALENSPRLGQLLRRVTDRGRRLRSDTLRGFLLLYGCAGLRRWRRGSLRHRREIAHLQEWLQAAQQAAAKDYDLAIEVFNCRRLIKGYADTHARGQSKFDKVLAQLPQISAHNNAAATLRNLLDAALSEAGSEALDAALAAAINR